MVSFLSLVLASPAFVAAPQMFELEPSSSLAMLEPSSLRLRLETPLTEQEDARYTETVRRRERIARIHRAFGLSTWSAMTLTVIFGTIQYYNMYGFFDGRGSNPCVTGGAVFGQGQCSGLPVLHLTSAMVTTGLYATTFSLSLLMPDPDDASSGNSRYARRLRLHKALRWVHLTGMVTQILFGFALGQNWFGLDRANDYGKLQTLATLHYVNGLLTYGALSWAAGLMIF